MRSLGEGLCGLFHFAGSAGRLAPVRRFELGGVGVAPGARKVKTSSYFSSNRFSTAGVPCASITARVSAVLHVDRISLAKIANASIGVLLVLELLVLIYFSESRYQRFDISQENTTQ